MTISQKIIETILSQPIVAMSWGLCNTQCLPYGVRFHVSGFIFSGIVQVLQDGESLSITLMNSNVINETASYENIVQVLDRLIERTSNYTESVKRRYEAIDDNTSLANQ